MAFTFDSELSIVHDSLQVSVNLLDVRDVDWQSQVVLSIGSGVDFQDFGETLEPNVSFSVVFGKEVIVTIQCAHREL